MKAGEQRIPQITEIILERIIKRDFRDNFTQVKNKLKQIKSDSESGRNRISADVLKLANGNLKAVEKYIELSNIDFRDLISLAENPRCSELGFEAMEKPGIEKVFIEDWEEYTEWLNK